jgi:predicted NUDIX family NTP pyrophosphohydrolase
MAEFPEVDRAAWYSIDEALEKITKGQRPIVGALQAAVVRSGGQ